MGNISVVLQRTASATLSVGNVTADATRPRRMQLMEAILSQAEATPADGNTRFEFQRCTTAGTGTAVTPQMLDPGDPATEQDALQNHTIDPTLTAGAILLTIPLNQRATFRFVAQPAVPIIIPATASNGLAVRTTVAALVATSVHLHLKEF